ncbi:pleiotropic drug resistance protein 2 [Artemisia annua]|uniref:Pleiotropic drug resistance protein 2 n=1 Tax=Artemisia annua TaxID=35608 RepID=A0A2U1NML1_ARTAN|nr:pleiotropic drug resistance protein 2 [Artemisia annua]
MDEPTSGLDTRAAAIVMRTVRNTVDTGLNFEAFDELLLMRRDQLIYAGSLRHHSNQLVEYFQMLPGVTRIKDVHNPATWMLEVSSPMVEAQLGEDFAMIYATSDFLVASHRKNQELIKELRTPAPGSQDLHFATTYSQPFFTQCNACLWKQGSSYWRHPQYNVVRFLMTTVIGIIFGIIFWDKGQKLVPIPESHSSKSCLESTTRPDEYAWCYMLLSCFLEEQIHLRYTLVSVERTVFYCEKAGGMYSPLPYVFAQYWGSPVAWMLYGLITSQLGQNENLVEVPGAGSVPVKEVSKSDMGFGYDLLHYVTMAHVTLAVLFSIVFACCIKFLKFQQR